MFKNLKKLNEKPKITTLDTINYEVMKKNGICKVDKETYSKTLEFSDITYLLAKDEDKETIFKFWFQFINSFNEDIDIQFSFINFKNKHNSSKIQANIDKDDEYKEYRKEYTDILKQHELKGTNGIEKRKYITFSVKAKDFETATKRLEKIEANIITNLKKLGVRSRLLNGKERLKLFHKILGTEKNFNLDEDWTIVKEQGIPTKALISPSYINFSENHIYEADKKFYQTVYISLDSSDLTDTMLSDILDVEDDMILTFHIKSMERKDSIKFVTGKDTDVKAMKVEYQQKAFNNGFSGDILPPKLEIFSKETDGVLYDLQYGNEKLFYLTITLRLSSEIKKELEVKIEQVKEIINKHLCNIINLSYRQEQALNSLLPLGKNLINMDRMVNTSSAAIFIPFLTQELFQSSEKAYYYGLNALSNNMIMADRTELRNPNGLILGTPGSGKSFAAKEEIVNSILRTDDDILVCDPEEEYSPLINAFKGQVIKISPNSTNYINPLDIDITGEEDPLPMKSDFILSLFELVSSSNNKYNTGLSAIEISVIDRCLPMLYKKYFEKPIPQNIPILEDLYNLLLKEGEVGKKLATEMEIYVKGSLNVFNNRTNINIQNRIVSFDIKEIGKKLQKIGMLIIYENVWNRVSKNRNKGRSTRYYIDEFHLLLRDPQTASYSIEMWKRFRKWGGIPTGITQNVKDLLSSPEIENIFDNTDFIILLNQASGDKEILANKLNISEHQLSYITDSDSGEGLIKYNDMIIPFVNRFPKNSKLYKVMTTKFEESSKFRKTI